MSNLVSSQQVSWWDVHSAVAPWLETVGSWPTVGTPEWCGLPDGAPAKIAALYDAAQHWALRLETCQQAECEASHAVSAACDWGHISRQIRDRAEFYSARPWLKRATS